MESGRGQGRNETEEIGQGTERKRDWRRLRTLSLFKREDVREILRGEIQGNNSGNQEKQIKQSEEDNLKSIDGVGGAQLKDVGGVLCVSAIDFGSIRLYKVNGSVHLYTIPRIIVIAR